VKVFVSTKVKLEQIAEMSVASPQDGQALVFDIQSQKWVNAAVEGGGSAASSMLQLMRYAGEDVTSNTTYETIFEAKMFGSVLRHSVNINVFIWHTVDAGVTAQGKIEITDGTHTVTYETSVIDQETKQDNITIDTTTLDDLEDGVVWTVSVLGKVVMGTGNYTVKRVVMKAAPSSVFSEVGVLASSPDATFNSTEYTHLQDIYIPYSFAYDSASQIRCLALVDGVSTIRIRLTADNGVESDYTDVELVASAAGIVSGYLSLPTVVSNVLKFSVYGKTTSGVTQTLQHYECWMEC